MGFPTLVKVTLQLSKHFHYLLNKAFQSIQKHGLIRRFMRVMNIKLLNVKKMCQKTCNSAILCFTLGMVISGKAKRNPFFKDKYK